MIENKQQIGKRLHESWPKILAFLAFIFLLFLNYDNWVEFKEQKAYEREQPAVAHVYGKTAVQKMGSGTSYFVLLDKESLKKVMRTVDPGSKVSVSYEQFQKIQIGDPIEGFRVNGTFYTEKELIEEHTSFYLTLLFFSLYPIGYILYWMNKLPWIHSNFKKIARFKFFDRTLNACLTFLLLGGVLVGSLFYLDDFINAMKNSYTMYYDKDKILTTAKITDKDYVTSRHKQRRSEYNLSLSFETPNKESIHLTKEVSLSTYYKYSDGEIPIVYSSQQPYQVYLQKLSLSEISSLLLSNVFFVVYCAIMSVLLLAFLPFIWWRWRKRMKGNN